jgi:hypothetical protein
MLQSSGGHVKTTACGDRVSANLQKRHPLNPSPSKTNPSASRMIEWLSRTIAIMVVMCLPGIAGMYADDFYRTKIWTPIGAVLGFILGTTLLIFLVTKFGPRAGGKPIPFREEDNEGELEEK